MSRAGSSGGRKHRRAGEGDGQCPPTTGGWTRTKASVVAEQNAHGAMSLRDCETNATYTVVAYASPAVRETARSLERDAVVEGRLVRVGCRANAWRVQDLAVVEDS